MLIEKYLDPRSDIPIKNKFQITKKYDPENFHIVVYYIEDNLCEIIIRRIDSVNGWDIELTIQLFSVDQSTSIELVIGKSENNHKNIKVKSDIKLEPVNLDYQQRIPMTIVQTDESYDLPLLKYNSVMSIIELNPEYEYIFFNKLDRRQFIRKHFSTDILEAYDCLVPGAYKADLFRYCYLYLYGGCYIDCKMVMMKPLREWINENDSNIFIKDVIPTAFANGIMYMEKHNGKLLDCISKIVKNVQDRTYKVDKLSISGPSLLYSVFSTYIPKFYFKKIDGDWCFNYKKSIIVDSKNELMCYVYYPGYYQDLNYKNANHYSVLYNKKMVYFMNKRICGKFIIYVFPHQWSDTFDFEMKDNQIIVKRTDKNERWGQHMIIKVINTETNEEKMIDIGMSTSGQKTITF